MAKEPEAAGYKEDPEAASPVKQATADGLGAEKAVAAPGLSPTSIGRVDVDNRRGSAALENVMMNDFPTDIQVQDSKEVLVTGSSGVLAASATSAQALKHFQTAAAFLQANTSAGPRLNAVRAVVNASKERKISWQPASLRMRYNERVRFQWKMVAACYPDKVDQMKVQQVERDGTLIKDLVEEPAGSRQTHIDLEEREDAVNYDLHVRFTLPGCDPDTCRIHVYSPHDRTESLKRGTCRVVEVGLFAAIGIGTAYGTVGYVKDGKYLDTFFSCKDFAEYCSTTSMLKEVMMNTAAPPFCMAALILIGILLNSAKNLVKPLPTLSSFGRGFKRPYVTRWRGVVGVSLLLPIFGICVDWRLNSKLTEGIGSLLVVFDEFVQELLDDGFTVLVSAKALLDTAESVPGLKGAVTSDTLASVVSYEGRARSYVQLGLELMSMLLTVRTFMNFVALVLTGLTVAYAVTGVLRKNVSSLRTARAISLFAMFFLLYNIGTQYFLHVLWMDMLEDYVDDNGRIVMDKVGESSVGSRLLSFCQEPSDDGTDDLTSILKPMYALMEDLGKEACSSGYCLEFEKMPTKASDMVKGAEMLNRETRALHSWLLKPDADINSLGLGSLGLPAPAVAAVVGHVRTIMEVLLSFLACEQLNPFMQDIVRTLDQEILPTLSAMCFVEVSLVLALLLWCLTAAFLMHMYQRPRKYWYDQVTQRWFVFRFSYKVCQRIRKDSGEHSWLMEPGGPFEPRVPWHLLPSLASLKEDILMSSTVVQVFAFMLGFLLLFANQTRNPSAEQFRAAAALLMISSPIGLLGSARALADWRMRSLRLASILLVVASATLMGLAVRDNFKRIGSCYDAVGFQTTRPGPIPSKTFSCQVDEVGCKAELDGSDMADGNRLLAVQVEDDRDEGDGHGELHRARHGDWCNADMIAESFSSASSTPYMSKPATLFGRSYEFPQALGRGTYTLCWCDKNCDLAEGYDQFAGMLFVGRPVDEFMTCSLSVMAGFAESAYMGAALLPVYLVRIVCGFLTLFQCISSAHITDRQRRIVAEDTAFLNQSVGITEDDNLTARLRAAGNIGTLDATYVKTVVAFRMRFLWKPVAVTVVIMMVFEIATVLLESSRRISYEGVTYETTEAVPPPKALPDSDKSCNLLDATCSRRVDEAAFATSHNVMSSQKQDWLFPNNYFMMKNALEAGVRGLMIDVWYKWSPDATDQEKQKPGTVYACHGLCEIGRELFLDDMKVLKEFLDANKRELVIMILEQYVASADVIQILQEAGLTPYLGYSHSSPATAWPTVEAMIANNHRLLLFSDKKADFTGYAYDRTTELSAASVGAGFAAASATAWWHYMWSYMTETAYTYKDWDSMKADCKLNRGAPAGGAAALAQSSPAGSELHRLTIVNHFISTPVANEVEAAFANEEENLQQRMDACVSAWKHQANFPTVDFWSMGAVVEVANKLNSR
eukprot:TRINITY_DN14694_c0_g1_i1.p1 TRINITY_DN14694_c0_g1~~TRINITY_DN14694_c0_g1_i1.p1  ORF type:complete len:1451 (+),score=328.05 TRINITY_DN14694_c0_g1_i1:160-4512(+)